MPLFNNPKPDRNMLDPTIQKSPFCILVKAWENQSIDMAYMQPFRAVIWYHHHGSEQPTSKFNPQGTRGVLLGQIASNISLVWNKDNDKIQHMVDRCVDDGKVELSELRKDGEKRDSHLPLSFTDDESESRSDGGGVNLHPARGFAASVATLEISLIRKLLWSYSDAIQHPDQEKWISTMNCEMEKLRSKDI